MKLLFKNVLNRPGIAFDALESNGAFFFRGGQSVFSWNPKENSLNWETKLANDNRMGEKRIVYDGTALFTFASYGVEKGVEIHAIDPNSGTVKWKKHSMSSPFKWGFAAVDGKIYLAGATPDGNYDFIAYDGTTGDVLQVLALGQISGITTFNSTLIVYGRSGVKTLTTSSNTVKALLPDIHIIEARSKETHFFYHCYLGQDGEVDGYLGHLDFSKNDPPSYYRVGKTNGSLRLEPLQSSTSLIFAPGKQLGIKCIDVKENRLIWEYGVDKRFSGLKIIEMGTNLAILIKDVDGSNHVEILDKKSGQLIERIQPINHPYDIFALGGLLVVSGMMGLAAVMIES